MAPKWRSFAQMAGLAIVSAGLFWVLSVHWRHALGLLPYLPYLLFLSCPLMHLFMHHGHEGHHHGERNDVDLPPARADDHRR